MSAKWSAFVRSHRGQNYLISYQTGAPWGHAHQISLELCSLGQVTSLSVFFLVPHTFITNSQPATQSGAMSAGLGTIQAWILILLLPTIKYPQSMP
jgi:hypothetical protein